MRRRQWWIFEDQPATLRLLDGIKLDVLGFDVKGRARTSKRPLSRLAKTTKTNTPEGIPLGCKDLKVLPFVPIPHLPHISRQRITNVHHHRQADYLGRAVEIAEWISHPPVPKIRLLAAQARLV
jgi:hypothetical protein